MKDIADLYVSMKKNNILSGIIIFDIIAFFSFLFNPLSLVALGDLDFIFGGTVGVIFALRNRKAGQGHLTLCLIVGIGGALLSALSISLVAYWVYYVSQGKSNLNTLIFIIIFFGMVAGIIGTLIGAIIGFIARLTSPRASRDSEDVFRPFKITHSTKTNKDQTFKREAFFCQIDNENHPSTDSAYKCIKCSRMICTDCYNRMIETGFPQCPYCKSKLIKSQ